MEEPFGVYFIIKDKIIIYIGKTGQLTRRLQYHKQQGIIWDKVNFIQYPEEKVSEHEKIWIQYFKPILNHANKHEKKIKVKTKFKKYHMRFRKLTGKSLIQFGVNRHRTVDNLISIKPIELVQYYFSLSHITFMDDILDKLKITHEWRIEKPGSDKEKFYEFRATIYPEVEAQSAVRFNRKITFDAKRVLKSIQLGMKSKNYAKSFNQF